MTDQVYPIIIIIFPTTTTLPLSLHNGTNLLFHETYQMHLEKSESDSAGDKGRLEAYFKDGLGCSEKDLAFIQSALKGELHEFDDKAFDDKGNLKEAHGAGELNATALSGENGVELVADLIIGKLSGDQPTSLKERFKGLVPTRNRQSKSSQNEDPFPSASDTALETTPLKFDVEDPQQIYEEEQEHAANTVSNGKESHVEQKNSDKSFKNQPVKLSKKQAKIVLNNFQDMVLQRYLDLNKKNSTEVPEQKLISVFNSIREKGYLTAPGCKNLLTRTKQ